MKTENRDHRWVTLRKKLRTEIMRTYDSVRLQTLVKRLNAVNRDNRAATQEIGAPMPEHLDVAISEVVAKLAAARSRKPS